VTPISNCNFDYRCPMLWEKLIPTTDRDRRFCSECGKDVFLCSDVVELRKHTEAGHCVAVEWRNREQMGPTLGVPSRNQDWPVDEDRGQ